MKKQDTNSKLFSHILILSLVMIIAVTATFSWYDRSVSSSQQTVNVLKYSQSGKVNGEGGSIKTFAGNNNNGKVEYSDRELSLSSGAIITQPGKINYFKTEITSSSDSAVSVYLENFSFESSLAQENIKVGIIQPEKTYKSFSVSKNGNTYTASNICLEDNLIVEEDKTTEIYWFVEISENTTSSGNMTLGTMHLVYN